MKNTVKRGILVLVTAVSVAAVVKALPARNKPESVPVQGEAAASSKKPIQILTELDGANSSQRETNLGDLIADAARDTGHADVAIIPADEILETQIPAGPQSVSRVTDALRYAGDDSDTISVLDLTGAQVLEAMERSVSRLPKPFDGFLQVSGLNVRYNLSQPRGKRVTVLGPAGRPIDPARRYLVATTRPMANGGLGYFRIWDDKAHPSDTKVSIAKSVETYVTGLKTVNTVVEGRIAQR